MTEAERILLRVRDGEKLVVENLYDTYFSFMLVYVKNNGGIEADAEDLFQECLMYLYLFSKKENAPEIHNFKAYFSTMYKNRWFVKLKNKKRERLMIEEVSYNEAQYEESDFRQVIYLKALDKLGEDCRQVLEYYTSGKKNEEVAQILKTTLDYAKRKKYLCKKKLKEIASQYI